ncbi:MAG: YlmC/YmxH family sporulation protein [Bacilli bacterium]|nr:YlmC/YmxH family sporulation protein [Bacilli bacterium]
MHLRLSDLQTKKIINVNDGKNVGNIVDVNIYENGSIESLIIESSKGIFSLNKELDIHIYWKDITKIGEDVILVKTGNNE